MIRGIVIKVIEGFIKLFSATGRLGESFEQREYFQHYGFTSRPLAGAEIIIIREGNHILAIASDDRRYRLALEEGEMAIYTDEGDKIHLKRDRKLHITSGGEVTVFCDIINLGDIREEIRKLIDDRLLALYNNHIHGGVETGGGQTGAPVVPLTEENVCTAKTKAG